MMPQSSQNLYFHLGMNADDDGFCEHFTVMRMTESKPDDLKVLQAKGFVKVFDDKVLIVLDWKENNYIQSDRYVASKYLEIYRKELDMLSDGIHNVSTSDTQVRLGKDRIGQDRIPPSGEGNEINGLIKLFEPINPSYERFFKVKTQREALARLLKKHGLDKLRGIIEALPELISRPYYPKITSPWELERDLGKLYAAYQQDIKKGQLGKNNVAIIL